MELWTSIDFFILTLENLSALSFITGTPSIPTTTHTIINHQYHWYNMRSTYLQNHCKNNLCTHIDVPKGCKIFILSLKNSCWRCIFTNFNIHIDNKQYKTKINVLDPTNCSDTIRYNLLFIDRSCMFSTKMNQDFDYNISNNDKNCNSSNCCKDH